MTKLDESIERDAARARQREERYQEAEDIGRGVAGYADDTWYAGRSLISEGCGLLSRLVVTFGRALAPAGDDPMQRDYRYGRTRAPLGSDRFRRDERHGAPGVATDPRTDLKAP